MNGDWGTTQSYIHTLAMPYRRYQKSNGSYFHFNAKGTQWTVSRGLYLSYSCRQNLVAIDFWTELQTWASFQQFEVAAIGSDLDLGMCGWWQDFGNELALGWLGMRRAETGEAWSLFWHWWKTAVPEVSSLFGWLHSETCGQRETPCLNNESLSSLIHDSTDLRF